MSGAVSFDLEKIFECCACEDDEQFVKVPFKRARNGFYLKHPPIGHGRELFFININPRGTNNKSMLWAMESPENFQQFSTNRYKDIPYIPNVEAFYQLHHRICKAIFPDKCFEDVAIVHEMYLCATPDASSLPRSPSPCAKRYLQRHLNYACPKLVVAFGKPAAEFFSCEYDGDKVLSLPNAMKGRFISLKFPRRPSNAWKAGVSDWIKRCFYVETSNALPPRDFGEAQRPRQRNGNGANRLHSYTRVRTSGTLSLICDPCPNYQPRGDRGAALWKLARDFAAAGATFQAATNRTGLPKGYLQYFIEKGGIAVDGLTGETAYAN